MADEKTGPERMIKEAGRVWKGPTCGGRRDRHRVPLTALSGKALRLLGLARASPRHV